MSQKIKILKKKLLHNNFVFVDGISKSGKIVVSTIISSLKNCENQSYQDRFSDYLKFANLKLLDTNLAIATILRDMQVLMIENRLSRFLNFRKHDLSSVNNSFKKNDYYKNLKIIDNEHEIEKIIQNLKRNKTLIPMVVDDFFPNCFKSFKYFYKFKKIIMIRNPIGIFYEYYNRNRIDKQINQHPWQNVFHYKKDDKKAPWYVAPRDIKKFQSANKIEKYLMSINSQYKPYLSNKIFKIRNTKFIFIEDLWESPKFITKLIARFLKTKETKFTNLILKKLDLPRVNINRNYEKQFYYLKNVMTNSEFKKLIDLENEYKKKKIIHGL